MQTFILACFVCLQLIDLSGYLPKSALIKKDISCDSCLTGLIDRYELLSHQEDNEEQSLSEISASESPLNDGIGERLMLDLLQRSFKIISRYGEQPKFSSRFDKPDLNDMQDEMLKNLKILSEEALEELKLKTEELNKMISQLQQDNHSHQTSEPPHRNILQNNEKLMAGESLTSENGRYKATLQQTGEFTIIDKLESDTVIQTVGFPINSESEYEVYMQMQKNGNLVIYNHSDNSEILVQLWSTNTINDHRGSHYYVKLENSGQLVMYDRWGYVVWNSGIRPSEYDYKSCDFWLA